VARSVVLTVLVYGGMVAAVVALPGLLCGAWGAFLLWFYRGRRSDLETGKVRRDGGGNAGMV